MILTAMTLSYLHHLQYVSTFYIKPCKLCVYGEEQKKELYYLQLWILQLANYLDIMKTFLFFFIKRWVGFFVFYMLILNLRFVHWELLCKFTNWIKGYRFCGLVGRSGRGLSFQLMGMSLRSGLPLSRPVFVCPPPHNRVISHSKWWSGTNTSFSLLKKSCIFPNYRFLLWKIKLICASVLG